MAKDYAIKVSNVSKDFKLPHEKVTSVKSAFVTPFQTKRAIKTRTQHALKDISFEVKKGEFFGIVGRNGSGKSTLLKILAGIYQPSKGSIHVDGRLVPFIELGVGFNPELTGRDNVYLNGALMGFSTKEIDAMYDDIIDFAELKDFMDQKLKNYSSGMQVRLAFSVATRSKADILLIDEVLAVGDADFQRKCFNYFKNLKKESKTVIFVSHDMDAVREYCDRCIMIDNSEMTFVGKPQKAAELYLKLFTKDALPSAHPPSDVRERWGDGSARVIVARVFQSSESIRVQATISFSDVVENPIIGFLINDATGKSICGTNNKVLGISYGVKAPGDEIKIEWLMDNIFSNGIHSVDVAVTKSDGITQADWWHDATTFETIKPDSTPHVVSPAIEMSHK